MERTSDFNVWRILFLSSIVAIIILIAYTITNVKEEVIIYEYQDVLDNTSLYVNGRNSQVNIYTDYRISEMYGIPVNELTKSLNETNAINLYRYVRRQFTFGEPRHLVEVLEQESGSELGLHSLLTSMYLSADINKTTSPYLLLTQYNGKNHSAVLLKINETTYYLDLTTNNTNISFDAAVKFLEVGQLLHLTDFRIRYAIGSRSDITEFSTNIDFYIWLSQLYQRG